MNRPRETPDETVPEQSNTGTHTSRHDDSLDGEPAKDGWRAALWADLTGPRAYRYWVAIITALVAAYYGIYGIIEVRYDRQMSQALSARESFFEMVSSGNSASFVAAMKQFGPIQTMSVPGIPSLLAPWKWYEDDRQQPNSEPLWRWAKDYFPNCTPRACGYETSDTSIRIDLRNSDLARANLTEVDLRDADLSDAKLTGARLVGADLLGAYLESAILDGADLMDAFLYDVKLNRAKLVGANLDGVVLSSSNMYGATLTRAKLDSANLSDAKLNDAILDGAILTDAMLFNSELNGANLNGALLDNADLNGAELIGAELKDVDLTEANLTGADLTEANLTGAVLNQTLVMGTNLTDVTLNTKAVMHTRSAYWDESTIWPESLTSPCPRNLPREPCP